MTNHSEIYESLTKEEAEEFAMYVLARRRKVGMTVEELATKAGLDPVFVQSLESVGEPAWQAAAWHRLMDALGLRVVNTPTTGPDIPT